MKMLTEAASHDIRRSAKRSRQGDGPARAGPSQFQTASPRPYADLRLLARGFWSEGWCLTDSIRGIWPLLEITGRDGDGWIDLLLGRQPRQIRARADSIRHVCIVAGSFCVACGLRCRRSGGKGGRRLRPDQNAPVQWVGGVRALRLRSGLAAAPVQLCRRCT